MMMNARKEKGWRETRRGRSSFKVEQIERKERARYVRTRDIERRRRWRRKEEGKGEASSKWETNVCRGEGREKKERGAEREGQRRPRKDPTDRPMALEQVSRRCGASSGPDPLSFRRDQWRRGGNRAPFPTGGPIATRLSCGESQ